ncbi:LysR substrate-binding domain-containing protein [Burkholderia sp. Ax-1719]|uniref:LysR substrate-binding domain-containing protein n=1 Tax=Burkholderia sp. Ax-1719 TaxID=2608334 RepID=UPI00141E69AA|nr:LysR substrate-binding domain-containing protein [Burkholderia sp. Ax-1719]NIE62427.1 LysR family transcriptional regulator [Burkholderia sp. Ax-1719]
MTRPLNFPQLQAFRAIMQAGTTIGAAAMLNTTQPSISRRLTELQNFSGLKLLEKHQGRLRPTREGMLLYRAIQKHFEGLDQIETVVAMLRRSGTGTLRIGCTPVLALGVLPAVVEVFSQRFPDAHLIVHTHATLRLMELLRQELFDCILTTGKVMESDFESLAMRTIPAVCVLPHGHRLANEAVVDVRMLRGERLITLDSADEITLALGALMYAVGLEMKSAIETTSSITVCAMVASGNGIGVVTPFVAGTFAQKVLIKPFVPAIGVTVSMATTTQTAPSLLASHFVEVLMEHLHELPPTFA